MYLHSSLNTCTSSCNSNEYYLWPSKICYPCDPSCEGCTGPGSNQCYYCPDPNFLHQESHTCTDSCYPNEYFLVFDDVTYRYCYPCDTSCLTCSSSSACLSCNPNSSLNLYRLSE